MLQHAMVYYMDTVVGSMVAALRQKNMWENTLWVHQSDNGGPSFTGSDHTANNFPQRGKTALSIIRTLSVATCLLRLQARTNREGPHVRCCAW